MALRPSNAVYNNNLAFVAANGDSVYARTVATNFAAVEQYGTWPVPSSATSAFPAPPSTLRPSRRCWMRLTQAFDAFPTQRGQVVLNLVNILSTLEGNATYGGAALTFNDTITASAAYSTNAGQHRQL